MAAERLARAATPSGIPPEHILSHFIACSPQAERERKHSQLSDAAVRALAEYEEIGLGNPKLRGWICLLRVLLGRCEPSDRIALAPLDVDVLLAECVRVMGSDDTSETTGCVATEPVHKHAGIIRMDDLTQLAIANPSDETSPFFGEVSYEFFFDMIFRAFHRTAPPHVIIVCERGVGERSVLLELARRSVVRRPEFLASKRFLLVDCRRVPSERLWSFLDPEPFGDLPEAAVLCLDGFGALLRSCASWERRSMLQSALGMARCRVLGLISPQDFEHHVSPNTDLQELFSVVHLAEPQPNAAVSLVRHFAAGLQSRHGLAIDDQAIRRAVLLCDSYILHERLPHKAVKVLRSICEDFDYDRVQVGVIRDRITEADVVTKVAELTGIPSSTLAGVGEGVDYAARLGEVIVGQKHAVREVAVELGLIKAGMVDPGKPASVMMFIGQTGTGKTEMAKALAKLYSSSKRLKTFTLGNFSEPHSVSGIIGVPPGYVGHDNGGRLVNELNADPYGVFLLDEADKAHPDVMQPFLNLFDEGWISDQKGNKAYANRAIFILTTNVGQRQIADMCRSGKSIDEIKSMMKDTLSRIRHTKSNRPVFSAEFLARVKRVIVFRSLDQEAMTGIAKRLASDLAADWNAKRQKKLLIPDALMTAIAKKGFALNEHAQGREGGRILRKLLADLVEAPVQSAISAAPLQYRQCQQVVVEFAGSRDHRDDAAASGDEALEELSVESVRVTFAIPTERAAAYPPTVAEVVLPPS